MVWTRRFGNTGMRMLPVLIFCNAFSAVSLFEDCLLRFAQGLSAVEKKEVPFEGYSTRFAYVKLRIVFSSTAVHCSSVLVQSHLILCRDILFHTGNSVCI